MKVIYRTGTGTFLTLICDKQWIKIATRCFSRNFFEDVENQNCSDTSSSPLSPRGILFSCFISALFGFVRNLCVLCYPFRTL
jgi:hypothetical protein